MQEKSKEKLEKDLEAKDQNRSAYISQVQERLREHVTFFCLAFGGFCL
jgi:hypothetical protein